MLLENLAALSLLKQMCLAKDGDGKHRSLRYLGTKEEQPVLKVEVKSRTDPVCCSTKVCRYFFEIVLVP